MKVKDLIKNLVSNYQLDDDLIVGYWDHEGFGMSKEEFSKFAEDTEERMDWSYTHEQLEWILNDLKAESEIETEEDSKVLTDNGFEIADDEDDDDFNEEVYLSLDKNGNYVSEEV